MTSKLDITQVLDKVFLFPSAFAFGRVEPRSVETVFCAAPEKIDAPSKPNRESRRLNRLAPSARGSTSVEGSTIDLEAVRARALGPLATRSLRSITHHLSQEEWQDPKPFVFILRADSYISSDLWMEMMVSFDLSSDLV